MELCALVGAWKTAKSSQSGDDVFDDCPVYVGQAEVAAGVTIRELLVVEAHEIEQGGVQVVDVNLVFDGLEAEVVGGAVDVASFKR
jgi:hypothetical protein